MDDALLTQLRSAQQELEPTFKELRQVMAALQQAIKQASEERADALTMQKALGKLQQAAAPLTNATLQQAIGAFTDATQRALDALAFEFARNLKEVFERRGQAVEGRPPTLVVDTLMLQVDVARRKAQWFYGKEPLTHPLSLSINAIAQAYDAQRKAILERKIDVTAFLTEVHKAWRELVAERDRRPAGGRINLVEIYSKVVLNRQSGRFWNAPSRSTFKDYERSLFVRDLVLAQSAPVITVDGQARRLRLSVATKNQAESASRSIWLPNGPLDGEYYADVTFEES
jgi:hypothetical protein